MHIHTHTHLSWSSWPGCGQDAMEKEGGGRMVEDLVKGRGPRWRFVRWSGCRDIYWVAAWPDEERGGGEGRAIWLQESAVYSVRVVVVSDTRHVAYYHRYAVRTEAVQLIQLWYTAIPWPYNPVSSISYNHDAWIPHGSSLMNKANSAVMSPFRNALSRNFSMLLLSPSPPPFL